MHKNRIIQTANALFARHGIETVSMKRIAEETSASEEALEAKFGSKEQLIEICMSHEIAKMETAISCVVLYAQSSMELLVGASLAVFTELSGFCSLFYKDLKKYPSAQKQLASFKAEFQNNCMGYFRECEKDGFFTSNIDAERRVSICTEEMDNLEYRYQAKMIRIFLKSFCTEKGKEELKRINCENYL